MTRRKQPQKKAHQSTQAQALPLPKEELSTKALLKKAARCEALATQVLPPKASEKRIEDLAFLLMSTSDQWLNAFDTTLNSVE